MHTKGLILWRFTPGNNPYPGSWSSAFELSQTTWERREHLINTQRREAQTLGCLGRGVRKFGGGDVYGVVMTFGSDGDFWCNLIVTCCYLWPKTTGPQP